MRLPQCSREQEVLDAVRSGRWPTEWGEEIRRHAETCAVCAETAFVAQEFQREAERAEGELQQRGARLPSAGLVWWKAQLAARRAAEQRAIEPIAWAERAACALSALAVVLLGIWQWPRLAAWLEPHVNPKAVLPAAAPSHASVLADWLGRLAPAWPGTTPVLLLAACAAAFLTFVAFTAYLVGRED
jgi:hypothetical protein